MPRSAAETRELVLATAHELFYWHSIKGTGVDTIAAKAGVAPTTLYRLFASKDDLVAAYVERAGRLYRDWFTKATDPAAGGARERLLALFDAVIEQVQPEHCRGCPFLMALTELPNESAAGHRHAVATKVWVRERIGELTAALPDADPERLADQLTLIMEGVYASVQALGVDGPARQARAFAESLLPPEPTAR